MKSYLAKMDGPIRTLQKKRTANFREDETKLLIQLWGSPSVQNKLFLTHRKAPVMRVLAANMQQRGFYRTPDEIKTRIRNLKCLYHRIKRSVSSGAGLGTVDPDWPHYKAMDAILSKEYPVPKGANLLALHSMEEQHIMPTTEPDTSLTLIEGHEMLKCEDIKQEIDMDLDDNDSWATRDSMGSDYEEEQSPTPPPLRPAPAPRITVATNLKEPARDLTPIKPKPIQPMPAVMQNFTMPQAISQTVQNSQISQSNAVRAVPTVNGQNTIPLLILNGLHQAQDGMRNASWANNSTTYAAASNNANNVSTLLRDLLELQRESLTVQREKLEVAKQRLEYDRIVGTQLITLLPMMGNIINRLSYGQSGAMGVPPPQNQEEDLISGSEYDSDDSLETKPTPDKANTAIKRKSSPSEGEEDVLKDSKILKSMLEEGIKKYMMVDHPKNRKKSESNHDHDNEGDSGIHNDDNSDVSAKSDVEK